MASRERLRRLHDATAEMTRSLDVGHRIRTAVRAARSLESAEAASLMLRDETSDAFVISAQEGLSETYAARQRIPMDRARAAYRGPDEHIVLDLRAGPLGDAALIRPEGLAKALAVPLVHEGRNARPGEAVPAGGYPLDRALRGESSSGEFFVTQRTTGQRRDLSVNAAPVHGAGGGVVGGVMTLHDVTDLHAAEREREEFLSIVSHELRTPLTPLKALAQLVRSRMRRSRAEGTELDLESLDRNLTAIERQVDRVNGVVNDLLSGPTPGRCQRRMEPLRFDLAATTRDVVQRYVDATEEEGRHHFTVEAPERLPVRGDQSRLEQLLMNLVGNAVKYSPSGGAIRVALEGRDGAAAIRIADERIGIPPADLPNLGQPFVRGTGRASTFAGMGVGLYVARLVAEGHGGSLRLESAGDGKGTTVRGKLPR